MKLRTAIQSSFLSSLLQFANPFLPSLDPLPLSLQSFHVSLTWSTSFRPKWFPPEREKQLDNRSSQHLSSASAGGRVEQPVYINLAGSHSSLIIRHLSSAIWSLACPRQLITCPARVTPIGCSGKLLPVAAVADPRAQLSLNRRATGVNWLQSARVSYMALHFMFTCTGI